MPQLSYYTIIFFHFVYFIFLAGYTILGSRDMTNLINFTSDIKYILVSTSIFFVNHAISYFTTIKEYQNAHPRNLFFLPYIRIIPMHLMLIIGLTLPLPLIFFLVLKTLADTIMHSKLYNQLLLKKHNRHRHRITIPH